MWEAGNRVRVSNLSTVPHSDLVLGVEGGFTRHRCRVRWLPSRMRKGKRPLELKSHDTLSRIGKGHPIIALSIVLFLVATVARAAEQKTAEAQNMDEQQIPVAIPVPMVVTQAAEVTGFLRSLNLQFAPSREIEKIQKELPELSGRMAAALRRTMKILQAQPTLEFLQTEEQLWRKNQLELSKWLSLLIRTADQLEVALTRLTDLQKTWSRTLETARAEQAPDTIIQQITTVLPAIETAHTTLQTQHRALLDLQGRVADEVAQCATTLGVIAQAQHAAVGGIARKERLPIWNSEQWSRARAGGADRLRAIVADSWADIEQYVHNPSNGMPIHLGVFVVLAVLFCAIRRKVHRWTDGEDNAAINTVVNAPFFAALIASLLFASWPYSPAPPIVRNLFEALALVPIIRLLKPTVDQRAVVGLYALGVLFFLDTLRHAFAGTALFDQVMVVLEALAGMGVLGWSLAQGDLQRSLVQASGSSRLHNLRTGAGLVFITFGVGLVAGVLGYMRIARLLISAVLIGGALAVALIASIRIVCGVAAYGLRVWPLGRLQMVRHHRELLEHRIHRVLVWMAIVAWSVRVLGYVGLLQPALSIVKSALSAKLERGSISVSLEDVLAFVLVVWAAKLLSGFIRFVLQEDVYSRRGVPPGKAFAASRLLHYVILAVGLVVGMGVIGVDLTKVTVLLGALGVGIGFGLQNVVNNFVSGLILLFEQPVHVGDFVEVGDLYGQVQRIGLRASIVRTRQGAEIIVPNSHLISEQVTNWTLSDQLRRISLPVGVSYGAAPQKVIEVIEAAAGAHPRVLKNPPPKGLFVGFGDSSIDFDLRVWTDQYADWSKIRSEVAVAVHDAVQAAGMAFPFPQREVRLLRDKEA